MFCQKLFCAALCMIAWITPSLADSSVPVNQDAIPVNYRLMDQSTFKKLVVGNTIAGVTSRSKSLYLLYFAANGSCEMWKQNQVYPGNWWAEKDELGRDYMRAFWPGYSSSQKPAAPASAGQNNSDATSIWYYVDSKQSDTLLVATIDERSPVLLLPGRAFPSP